MDFRSNSSSTTVDRKVKRRTQSAVYIQALVRGYLGRKAAQNIRSTQEVSQWTRNSENIEISNEFRY
jgi:hypothetical protein